jgi:uncharacterized membrane protein
MIYNPLTLMVVGIFFVVLIIFFVLVQINVIALAFAEIGIPTQYIFMILMSILLGSFINIPIKRIPQKNVERQTTARYYGMSYSIPIWRQRHTLLAVNLGGAVIPMVICLYLLFSTGLFVEFAVATALMTGLCYHLARPVPRLGIALPPFIPPIAAAVIAVLIAYPHAPVVAYVSGTLGTLLGADIFKLKKITELGAPIASIGGAGTFDGIFLTGILSVLLSALLT